MSISTCPETFNLWVTAERIQCRHQQQYSINMLAGTAGECLARLHALAPRLTVNYYQDFLLHDLPKLLEDILWQSWVWMWYMHDGAPAHFSCVVRDILNNTYHVWWRGRARNTAWPPHSPDLNPLQFYTVRTPKNPCVCSSCWQQRTSLLHCGCLSDHLQLSWHLSMDVVVHNETCWGMHCISWRTSSALIINVLFQL
jgi:hypothetical protein